MVFRRITAISVALIAAGSVFTGCSSKDGDTEPTTPIETTQTTEATTKTAATEPLVVEDAVSAGSGDAYLAIADGQWYVQYWGTDADLLTYDAGVATITGNGDYTVSVNGASKGMIYDVTGSADGNYTPSGCSFMAVIVKDGSLLYPKMSIDITAIRVDGVEIDRTAASYTCSDDTIEMRSNIFNEWVKTLPEDAHCADGQVTDDTLYSPRIIDPAQIGAWKKIEVDFTVSGIGDDSEETDEDTEEYGDSEDYYE